MCVCVCVCVCVCLCVFSFVYKQDLALNNPRMLICHKTQPNQIKQNQRNDFLKDFKEQFIHKPISISKGFLLFTLSFFFSFF